MKLLAWTRSEKKPWNLFLQTRLAKPVKIIAMQPALWKSHEDWYPPTTPMKKPWNLFPSNETYRKAVKIIAIQPALKSHENGYCSQKRMYTIAGLDSLQWMMAQLKTYMQWTSPKLHGLCLHLCLKLLIAYRGSFPQVPRGQRSHAYLIKMPTAELLWVINTKHPCVVFSVGAMHICWQEKHFTKLLFAALIERMLCLPSSWRIRRAD